jgi:orotate phosphoribosyltransferase
MNTSTSISTLPNPQDISLSQAFIEFAISQNVLRFGDFKTKAGRLSPYFFNAGLFNTGEGALKLADFYAQTIVDQNIEFDVIFGPAYKGIPLCATIAASLYQRYGINKGFAYNRKEVKDHGEGGVLVGHPLVGKVLIVDDVISAGTSINQSIEIIQKQASVAGVLIALDRMEKAGDVNHIDPLSASLKLVQAGISVHAIANLKDLLLYVKAKSDNPSDASYQLDVELLEKITAYQQKYGI